MSHKGKRGNDSKQKRKYMRRFSPVTSGPPFFPTILMKICFNKNLFFDPHNVNNCPLIFKFITQMGDKSIY